MLSNTYVFRFSNKTRWVVDGKTETLISATHSGNRFSSHLRTLELRSKHLIMRSLIETCSTGDDKSWTILKILITSTKQVQGLYREECREDLQQVTGQALPSEPKSTYGICLEINMQNDTNNDALNSAALEIITKRKKHALYNSNMRGFLYRLQVNLESPRSGGRPDNK